MFGDQDEIKKAMVDKIIYTKTLQWEYENEHRLVIPLRAGENWGHVRLTIRRRLSDCIWALRWMTRQNAR